MSLIDRLSVHYDGKVTPLTILYTPAQLSMRHSYTQRIWVSFISVFVCGLAPTLFGTNSCLFFLALLPLSNIAYWTLTSLSLVEATSEGVYRRYWHGREQWLKWTEIASVEHNDFTGVITLADFSRKKVVRFTHHRINLDKFATILTVLCPHLWRFETYRAYQMHPMKYLYFVGVLTILFGLVYLVALESIAIAYIALWVIIGGALLILSLYPNRMLLNRTHFRVQSFWRTKSYHLANIREIMFVSDDKRDQSTTHAVQIWLQDAKQAENFFSGIRGGTIPFFCTLQRALLDYQGYPVTVKWVEAPKKAR